MSWLIGIHFGSGRSAIRRWLSWLAARWEGGGGSSRNTELWFPEVTGRASLHWIDVPRAGIGVPSWSPLPPSDSLVRTLSWLFLRERICEWVGNARSFKTCKRVLMLLLLVGAGGCSDVPVWEISMAWLGLGQEMMWSLGAMACYVSTQINLRQWQSNFCFLCCIT